MRTLCVAVVMGLLASAALAQDKPAATQSTTEQMMAEWMKYAAPGPQHEKLKPMVGKFAAEVTAQMAPGAPAETSKGVMTNEMILGGRYVKSDYLGEMTGQPFAGMGLFGYDNARKKYVALWVDQMSTALMVSEGSADDAGKVITMIGTMDDPVSGAKRTMKQVTTLVDDDHHTFEQFDVGPDGKETKNLTIKYTRIK